MHNLSDLEALILVEAFTGEPARPTDKPLLRHGNSRPISEREAIWEANQSLHERGLVDIVTVGPRVQIKRVRPEGKKLAQEIIDSGALDGLTGPIF